MVKNFIPAICLAAMILSAGCTSPPEGAKEETGVSRLDDEGKTVTTQETGSGGLLDDIKGLFQSRPGQYMVDYATTFTMEGRGESGRMAFYYGGGDRVRTDTVMDDRESRFYMNRGDFVMCGKEAGEWTCIKLGEQGAGEDVNKDMEEVMDDFDTSPVTRLPERVIAGTNCKCFGMTINADIAQAKGSGLSEWDHIYCLSPEGIPLYMEVNSAEMSSIMKATKYSTRVSDSDFIPPAEPTDISGLMEGMEAMDASQVAVSGADSGDMPEDLQKMQCDMCASMPDEESAKECRKAFDCD
ncbi:MAG: hypothetical protein JW724_03665 [Candidatus Altiarchaeota archaeon]|nr:hypothetical protein [Candidatus Altiarchaeota archaeon]